MKRPGDATACLMAAAFLCAGGQPVRAEQALTVGIIDLFPMGHHTADGDPAGLYIDIVNEVSRKSDLPINKVVLPFRRAFRAVLSGKMDLFLSFKRADLAKDLKFLGSVGCAKMLIVARKGISFGAVEDLSGKRVGFVQGASTGKIYAEKFHAIPVYVPGDASLVELLVRGRIDQFMVNSIVYNSYHQGLASHVELPENWQNTVGQPLSVKTHDIHFSVSRKSKYFKHAGRLEEAIKEVREDGGFDRLFRKWGTRDGGDCAGLASN